MTVPFDAIVLRAVVGELAASIGAQVQRIVQASGDTVVLDLYGAGEKRPRSLLLSASAEAYRAHFVTTRPAQLKPPPTFCATLRARLIDARLVRAEQVQGDRLLELEFSNRHLLIAELMGKHSNVILVDECGRSVGATKWVGRDQSVRPVRSGSPYVRPPVLGGGDGLSPFARRLLAAGGAIDGPIAPVLSPGAGAYPYSVAALGLAEERRETLSLALEEHYARLGELGAEDAARRSLAGALSRALASRERAIEDVEAALSAGLEAEAWQRAGELILAFGAGAPEGASALGATDYDGTPRILALDPELDYRANADGYFARARKAKLGRAGLAVRLAGLRGEREELAESLRAVASSDAAELPDLRAAAARRRWLAEPRPAKGGVVAPKFDGHRVRETTGPGGFRVLYGENAEANDYLTSRLARPNDWWLHVRGGTSAHVVVASENRPDRVGAEALRFAAGIAIRHSASKHAGLVAVDYTLRKYVRKPRGGAAGSALYTHEKTLHVSADESGP